MTAVCWGRLCIFDYEGERYGMTMGFKSVEEFLQENSGESAQRSARASKGDKLSLGAATKEIITDEKTTERGKRIILQELAGGNKTRYELRRKLEQGKIPQEAIGGLLRRCEELKLIDDEDYAIRWVQTRSVQKHLGRNILIQELTKKGVEKAHIDEALERYAIADEKLAQCLVDKKLARDVPVRFNEREKYKRRLLGFLMRRGIPYEIATRVIIEKLTPSNR